MEGKAVSKIKYKDRDIVQNMFIKEIRPNKSKFISFVIISETRILSAALPKSLNKFKIKKNILSGKNLILKELHVQNKKKKFGYNNLKRIGCLPRVKSQKGGLRFKKSNYKLGKLKSKKMNIRRVQSSKIMKMDILKNFYV